MKGLIRILAAAAVMLGAGVLLPMRAQAYSVGITGTEYKVTDFGAKGGDKADDYYAIQSALDKAANNSHTVTVSVPKGTYYLSGELKIYSGTVFRLDTGAVLKSTNDYNYIMVQGYDSTSYTYGKPLISNITVSGGVWDANRSSTAVARGLIRLRNANNVTIEGVTFQNVVGTHFAVLDGVSNGLVKNCTFKNFKDYTGTAAAYEDQVHATINYWCCEALHIDYLPKGSAELNGKSYLASGNFEVTGCTFENLPSAVGTHHVYDYMTQRNIKVHNNTFKNCRYHCLNATGFTDLSFESNKIENCGGMVWAQKTTGKIRNNTASLLKSPSGWWYDKGKFSGSPTFLGIDISAGSNVDIRSNTISGGSSDAISIVGSKATVVSNTVKNSKNNCLCVRDKASATVLRNTFSYPGFNGVSVKNSSTLTGFIGNTIKNTGNNGVYAYNSVINNASDNVITNTIYNGYSLANGSKAVIKNNIITSASDNGVYINSSSACTAEGNDIVSCKKNAFVVTASSASISITKNNLRKNTSYDLLVRDGSKGIIYKSNGSDKNKTKIESGCTATVSGSGLALDRSKFSIPQTVASTGKKLTPAIRTSYKKDKDFTIDYGSFSSAGKAQVVITGKGSYSGTFTLSYIITPSATAVTSVKKLTAGQYIAWNRCTSGCDTYTVLISDRADMSYAKVYTRGGDGASLILPGLTPGKTYYVQVRGNKIIDGREHSGSFSAKKSFKV